MITHLFGNLVTPLVLAGKDPLSHNYDYPILSLPNGWMLFSNHLLMMLVVTLFMLIMMPRVGRAVSTGKTGTSHDYVTKGTFNHMIEVVCVYFRDQVCKPVLGANTDKFMPFVWTLFFFILLNNLLGLVPLLDLSSLVVGSIQESTLAAQASPADPSDHQLLGEAQSADSHDAATHEPQAAHEDAHASATHAADEHDSAHASSGLVWFRTPEGHSHFHGIGGTATGNIWVTLALALISITIIIGSGIKSLGVGGFFHHLTLGAPPLLWPLTVLLEIIGLIAKPFALTVRLFANMTAGHVMLAVILGFCTMAWNGLGPVGGTLISIPSVLAGAALGLLETLVAFIQAYIFTFLTVMFISMFQHHDHDHDHGHDHDHAHDHAHHGHGGMQPAVAH